MTEQKIKHTPGPWVAVSPNYNVHNIRGAKNEVVTGDYKESVCHVYGRKRGLSMPVIANARLIAAAPELLAACLLLIEQHDASGDYTMGGKLTNEPFLLARAAIDKATA